MGFSADGGCLAAVFQTELLGIEGVEPEGVANKAAENLAEKVAGAVKDAADAAKTVIADTDSAETHEEL